jgi:hypothetical protein
MQDRLNVAPVRPEQQPLPQLTFMGWTGQHVVNADGEGMGVFLTRLVVRWLWHCTTPPGAWMRRGLARPPSLMARERWQRGNHGDVISYIADERQKRRVIARRGDTKPFCHVAHASVALLGMSLAYISRDKALVLCQEGSPRTPQACSSCRHRGSPFSLGKVAAWSTTRHKLAMCAGIHAPSPISFFHEPLDVHPLQTVSFPEGEGLCQ